MVKIKANAKLNLMLRIVGKKSDGYHLLQMINVPINIFDEISIEPFENGFKQTFIPNIDCPLEKTTLYKAYNLFSSWLGFNPGIKITVKKEIPPGSGMGGGSSDAGFFLKYLSKVYDVKLNEQKISEIATKVGADVPFFIYNKPAFVTGIGEKVFPLNNFPNLIFLVIVPDFSISTSWAYSQVKLPLTKNELDSNLINSIENLEALKSIMRNDLESIAEKSFPAIIDIKNFFRTTGAEFSMMTGSGSAVFGIYKDKEKVLKAKEITKELFKNYRVFICHTIGA